MLGKKINPNQEVSEKFFVKLSLNYNQICLYIYELVLYVLFVLKLFIVSSPENNRNINKKLKMNHSQIDESMELLESNAENNLGKLLKKKHYTILSTK